MEKPVLPNNLHLSDTRHLTAQVPLIQNQCKFSDWAFKNQRWMKNIRHLCWQEAKFINLCGNHQSVNQFVNKQWTLTCSEPLYTAKTQMLHWSSTYTTKGTFTQTVQYGTRFARNHNATCVLCLWHNLTILNLVKGRNRWHGIRNFTVTLMMDHNQNLEEFGIELL